MTIVFKYNCVTGFICMCRSSHHKFRTNFQNKFYIFKLLTIMTIITGVSYVILKKQHDFQPFKDKSKANNLDVV